MARKYSKKRKMSHARRSTRRTNRRSTRRTNRRSTKRSNRKQSGGRPKLYENDDENDVNKVIELTKLNFDDKLDGLRQVPNTPGIVMMYADWCPHCNSEETINAWKKLGKMTDPKHGYVAAMNCAEEENAPFARRHGVNSYPTILFIKPDGTFYK